MLGFQPNLDVRVVRAMDGFVRDHQSICYRSAFSLEFLKWAADDGALLKKELEKVYTFASRMIKIMLIGNQQSRHTDPQNHCTALEEEARAVLEERERNP